jgi:protein gp37
MNDLFQNEVPIEFISRAAATMKIAKWHTYQVLTKRSKRTKEMLLGPLRECAADKHIWWGVSVEDKKYRIPRIADLLFTTVGGV